MPCPGFSSTIAADIIRIHHTRIMSLYRFAVITVIVALLLGSGCLRKQSSRSDDLGCVSCVLWDRYASFSIRADSRDKSGTIHFQYFKHVHNLRVDVSKDRYLIFSVLYIPGAGYFYKNVGDEIGCRADVYEQLVLQAKIVLYMLSRAYPDGPGTHLRTGSFTLRARPREPAHEFSVTTGTVSSQTLQLAPPWGASGKLVPYQDSSFSYEMRIDSEIMPGSIAIGQTIAGDWSADADVTVIDASEALANWRTCYTGRYDFDASTGKRLHIPDLVDSASFRSFGEVLDAVREARFREVGRPGAR